MASDEQIVERLRALLKEVDMQTTSEKMLRKMLEKEFDMDMSSKKDLIRAEVNKFLEEEEPDEANEDVAEDGQDNEQQEEEDEQAAGDDQRGAAMGSILSPEMQAFLGVESMPRPKVVKAVWAYIKEHNLQNPKDKRKLVLDDKLKTLFSGAVTMFTMNKQLSRHCKTADGESRSRPRSAVKRKRSKHASCSDDEDGDDEQPKKKGKPSGFQKPVKVSPAMAEFLGMSEISRGQFTKFICEYANEHNLKDPTDKRYIIPDERMAKVAGKERFMAFGGTAKLLSKHVNKD